MELWDAYDRDFKKIQGVTLVRGDRLVYAQHLIIVSLSHLLISNIEFSCRILMECFGF